MQFKANIQFIKYLAAIALLFLVQLTSAQNKRISFENISLEQGLSQSTVTCILQDSQGFIWFGTLDGLNRYDGYSMAIFRKEQGDRRTIIDNEITAIFEAQNGDIWVGTKANAVSRYNRIKNNFTNFSLPEVGSKSTQNFVRTIYQSSNGLIWLGTETGLVRFNSKSNSFTSFQNSNRKLVSINKITGDSNGYLWIATSLGLNKFNPKTGSSAFFRPSASGQKGTVNQINDIILAANDVVWVAGTNGLSTFSKGNFTKIRTNKYPITDKQINTLTLDSKGLIWFGTATEGLFAYKPKKDSYTNYKHDPSDAHSLSSDNVRYIFEDRSGILWVGTSLGGVNKWNRAAEDIDVFRHNPYDPNSLSNNLVRCIYESNNGAKWIGTVEGGLNQWISEERRFVDYQNQPNNSNSLSSNHVRCIVEDSVGNFWVATDGGGLNIMQKNGSFKHIKHHANDSLSLASNRVWHMIVDSKKQLWLATMAGLQRYNYETKNFKTYTHNDSIPSSLSSNAVTHIFEASNGHIWVGTLNGLNRLNTETGEFTKFFHDSKNSNSIGHNKIYSIIEGSDNDIWVGTKTGGLNRFISDTNGFERIGIKDGLPNNVVMGILEDDHKNLWISTNSGLTKFNKVTRAIRNFDVRDGLQSNEFLVGSFSKSKDGEMFFGGINGFNAFYPDAITDNPNEPEIVVTNFKVFNKTYKMDSTVSVKRVINLPNHKNFISFDFVALDYVFPEKNQYAYKLEGYDKDWNFVENRRFASYTDLPPKNYIFRVIGSNNDEVWNESGTQISIKIHPAFWQTNWFRLSLAILIISLIIGYYRYRMQEVERQKIILEQQVIERTAEVVQQKEEIEAQRDEIEAQRDHVLEQKDLIAGKNKEIQDSIEYALHIQQATLEIDDFDNNVVDDYFILFRPKDIVSGDFYWAADKDDFFVVVAADCTGHGVPGAFMSMLGISFLNKIVHDRGVSNAGEILNRLRNNVIKALHQRNANSESRDGMDVSLCVIDKKNMKLYFAGANNPLYFVRNSEASIIKGDKMPVAIYDHMDPFQSHELQLQKGDKVYIFSDGFPDQFGGPKGKKFMYKPFRKLLTENSDLPASEQKAILETKLDDWMGELEQIDDILVIGLKV